MKISIKYKLIGLLLISSVGGLFFYAAFAINLFIKDKKTYIYDSSEIVAKTLSNQVRVEISSFEKIIEPMVKSIDQKKFSFSKISNEYFLRQNRIEHVFTYLPTTGSSFQLMDHMYLPERAVKRYAPGGEVIEEILKQTMEKGFALQEVKSNKRYFVIGNKEYSVAMQRDFIVLAVFASPDLYEAFATPSTYKNYLLSKNQFLSMEPKYKRNNQESLGIASVKFFDPIFQNQFPTGVAELDNFAGKRMLVAFSRVGISDLIVASVVEKDKIMSIIEEFTHKSLFFVFNIISLSVLIGFVASQGLVSALREMKQSLLEIQNGNFNKYVNVNSGDEVSVLADELNTMSKKLQISVQDQ